MSADQRRRRVQDALAENVDFSTDAALGYPVSQLDGKVFSKEAPFIKDAPTLQVFVANPNHIGCHTLGVSESAFRGTQALEQEVIRIVAQDIFKAEDGEYDGYVASGGTEANIQAIWMYRNFFMSEKGADLREIAILASTDTHYSIAKASNLLMIDWLQVPVHPESRQIETTLLEQLVREACDAGKKYFIAVANMGTTMFGSVDDPSVYSDILQVYAQDFRMHIDGAYGGFVYPFSHPDSTIDFRNPSIGSFTIDAHKMLQAPYGTGIFICRKGLIHHTLTREAQYVEGLDVTLCGSRSGSNAVAVWMILNTYGPHGWFEKVSVLQMRTTWFCNALTASGIEFFRDPNINIVTIKSKYVPDDVARRFSLVPQTHGPGNEWYKVVLMEHVEVEQLAALAEALSPVGA